MRYIQLITMPDQTTVAQITETRPESAKIGYRIGATLGVVTATFACDKIDDLSDPGPETTQLVTELVTRLGASGALATVVNRVGTGLLGEEVRKRLQSTEPPF